MATITLNKEEVDVIQKAHARVQVLEEMYSENAQNDNLREKILVDLSDAKLKFENAKDQFVVSKLPDNANWSLDYATGIVNY